ncbi:hypothetical protein [Paraburkholderia antibiotica]|uniref:Uncharacterized protein n=1 Tax=Paraburkholderia antibiotica TaxID=2728839 RepID=A0A7X9ZWN0_9BURK|nr:hypothetical protein [Paraburkholderia antibiotica]NML31344.1 hypothetical protein [Paraburkholderia antibiotica]
MAATDAKSHACAKIAADQVIGATAASRGMSLQQTLNSVNKTGPDAAENIAAGWQLVAHGVNPRDVAELAYAVCRNPQQ